MLYGWCRQLLTSTHGNKQISHCSEQRSASNERLHSYTLLHAIRRGTHISPKPNPVFKAQRNGQANASYSAEWNPGPSRRSPAFHSDTELTLYALLHTLHWNVNCISTCSTTCNCVRCIVHAAYERTIYKWLLSVDWMTQKNESSPRKCNRIIPFDLFTRKKYQII